MRILELKDIGKIYATKENVAVGIRGVNLSFDMGEFVAITGESGSGKTSLLNVISGMDSYEEGELFICGESTVGYNGEDWEAYRQNYIAFIFQEYNIIDSFSVLENVELALMHIGDLKERKRKAMELIEQVGMSAHTNQKGSHLSGGQKQRTAIARALAKDSPIIIADEPTGNLDSESAIEVLRLLKSMSEEKLVILVTHNFEQVEEYATREIRINNGEVKSDNKVRNYIITREKQDVKVLGKRNSNICRDGIAIGWTLFRTKPKLTMFISLLLLIASVSIYLFTGIVGKEVKYNMWGDSAFFTEEEGRVIVVKDQGGIVSDEKAAALAETYGAQKYIHCDILCDQVSIVNWRKFLNEPTNYISDENQIPLLICSSTDYGKPDVGRYPESASECLLYVPYAVSDYFGKDEIRVNSINQNELEYEVVGIKYFTDNNKIGKMLLTDEGYRVNAAITYIGSYLVGDVNVNTSDGKTFKGESLVAVSYSFDVEPGKVYVELSSVSDYIKQKECTIESKINLLKCKVRDNMMDFETVYMDCEEFLFMSDNIYYCEDVSERNTAIVMNPYTILSYLEDYINMNYSQCSLYFNSEEDMISAIKAISATEYTAIASNTKYISKEHIISDYFLGSVAMVLIWVVMVFFMGIFVSVCLKKANELLKTDVNIMRSVGVDTRIIKVAIYVRMILLMIPAVLITMLLTIPIYRNAFGNRLVMYLYPVHYCIIFMGVFMIALAVTRRQIKIIFKATVKKVQEGDFSE